MDNNMIWLNEERIKRTVEAINKNNMNGYFVQSREELIAKIEEIANEGDVVSCGGSMSLAEAGVMDLLRSGKYNFLDRAAAKTPEEAGQVCRDAFSADVYFTSSNAVTEDGYLYNVDGNGNRVAAMIFGPKKVVVVVGVNKIVKDEEAAIKRNREVAAPANAKRLNRDTPCAKVGYCMDCKSPQRICRQYTMIKSQGDKNRVHVIIINENLGY